MKKCTICLEIKDFEKFVRRSNRKNPYQPYCKLCHNKKMRLKYNSEYMSNYDIKNKYGITLNDFRQMSENQNNKCMICDRHINDIIKSSSNTNKKKRLCIDHCHKTGKIRGLLCDKCNRAIGLFGDNIELLEKAIKYLNK